jgi:uncharacterized protein
LIAVDTNILVYAHRRDSEWHRQSAACVKSLAEGKAVWTIPWPCLHEFFAIVTNRKIFVPPSAPTEAINQVENWLASPSLQLIAETPAHWEELKRLVLKGKVTGGLTHDARVAAICLAHGVSELWTADRDFQRFPDIRTRNPLVA